MNKNKKALFVATILSHIKSFHEPYLKLLSDNGYKTYVASKSNLNSGEKVNYCDEFVEIPIERNPFKLNNIKAIKQLKRVIEKENFDIIHCHTPMGSVVARLAAKKARKKNGTRVIYTAHGFHFFKGAPKKNWIIYYPVEWFLAKYTDTLITINKEDYELAKRKFSKRCKDIQYVPGVGIDVKRFQINLTEQKKNSLKESLGLKKEDFVLTCVARLDNNKNQGFLISVVEELVKKHNNIHLLLVGRDELNDYYQKMTKEKKLNNFVHFLGNRDDIPYLLSITDVVVSASKREGLPVNVMEAFASGKPVVALKCRGMEDLITSKTIGYIVENSDCDDFCEKILNIYNRNIARNAFEKQVKLLSIDNILKKIKDIYFKGEK